MTPFKTTTRQRLGIIATACLMSVALPAAPAWAQKVKNKGAPAAETTALTSEVNVDIPTIEAVDSNVDDETLRSIFSGNVVDNAEALAGLTATSITIPEITMATKTTVDGEVTEATVTFNDLVLTDVTDGVAATVTMAGMTADAGDNGSADFGALSASSLNIGGVLGMYGLVDNGQTELQTIYTDFNFEGGTFEAPEVSCTMGAVTAAQFKARPFKYSFAEIMALAEQLEAAEDEQPSPEVLGKALRMYVDLFTAFESSPAKFGGFDCSGVDDEGSNVTFSVAGMSMEGMRPGIYPSISLDGLDIEVDGDGSVQVGNMTFKEMDLSAPIAAIEGAPEAIDEAWLTENARALIPAFAGFSFSDVAVDVPDPEAEGERIKASVGSFDLTLGDYLNGIPTDILTSASNILVDLPENSDDPQLQQLIALGVTNIDAGFTIDASWNEADETISVDEVSVTGANLATIKLAGTIANATKEIFGLDEEVALMASMGVAISQLKLDVTDDGLSDIILASVAAEQGSDPATMRPVFAGLAEGTMVGLLAGAAEAQKVGAALNAFVSGKAKYLTIEMTAKEPPGLGMMDFMAAEQDPTVLIGKVNIDATAK
ncbi:hypothetical protein JI749_10455 [Devosia oryziradicis]|uniref:DUF2125 domain-containing protein n=1 Tax=Devosia oryziradicis TaxID=2801335 RepID=A0ABX7BSP1_9HYPH|nr:hypothetical protein [Devosia oryziradicis]QQR34806.1 hypothetical protein JI749_10455 [Devosia oryziradicis]